MFGRVLIRIAGAAALPLALALALAGCAPRTLDEVHPGMMFTDVEDVMGEPQRVIHGNLVDTGKTTWVYPQGKVLFEGCTVIRVEKDSEQPSITERVEQQKGTR